MHDLAISGDVVLEDGTVLTDGWIGLSDGSIASISQQPIEAARESVHPGKLILPGFVDVHVHARSNPDEGIAATTTAAAAGGTTTVVDMPFDAPARPVNSVERLEAKIADVNREAVVDVGLYATFAPTGPLDHIGAMASLGAVGFKVSTIEVDKVRFPRIPDGRLYEAFQEIAGTNRLVAAHQENQEISDLFSARAKQDSTNPLSHARSRPPVAEAEAAGRLLELAYWSGAHLHMVHGTIPRTFDLINWHRSQGVAASGETCIHYLILDESALTELGGRAKCNPPLRSRDDVAELWVQLEDREIDIVTSDHSPYALANKDTASIFDAYAGLPGAATLGTLLYSEGVARGRISLATFTECVCSGPADIFGFEKKGRIAIGYDGDLVVFDPDARHNLDVHTMHYRVGWSTFDGYAVTGRVLETYVRGTCVFRGDKVIGGTGHGAFVAPAH